MRLSTIFLALLPLSVLAQVPQAFEFQGAARDLSGNLLVSQAISLRLGIVSGTSGGPLLYQETQATTTSALGLFTVQVGNGTPVLGTFAAIAWSTGPRFLKVEMDPAAGTSYQHMGTTQLLSVPYALEAGSTPCFTASATGDTLRQGNGCYLIIPGLSAANPTCTDADGDGFFSLAGCGTAVDCDDSNPAIKPGATELCDGIDNNCSGAVDEGNPGGGAACTTGQAGVCANGIQQCVGGALTCVPSQSPSTEVCDGLDNNCNGAVDEGNPGGGLSCNTGQAGVCSAGTTQCQSGVIVCVANVNPSAEVCDGLDNNCNGAVDEGNPGGGVPCTTGQLGVCSAGTTQCQSGAIVCVRNVNPSAEICDGLDNNCSGAVDEGNPGGGIACNTGLLGVCSTGTTACSGGAIICVQNVSATAEVCDGLDNNCNGAVDDGAASACNDGLTCTTDACSSGTCTNTVQAGFCRISGVCYANGTLRPGFPCQVCNSSVSNSAWSNVTSGTVCAAASCSGGVFTAASVCNGAGSCVAGSTTNCSPYTCNTGGTACLTSCTTSSQCASGFYCNGSTCVALKAAGSPCALSGECASGFCVDGVCCSTSCTSTCKRCNIAGSLGTCSNIPAGTDPDNECTGNCNGAGACGP